MIDRDSSENLTGRQTRLALDLQETAGQIEGGIGRGRTEEVGLGSGEAETSPGHRRVVVQPEGRGAVDRDDVAVGRDVRAGDDAADGKRAGVRDGDDASPPCEGAAAGEDDRRSDIGKVDAEDAATDRYRPAHHAGVCAVDGQGPEADLGQ